MSARQIQSQSISGVFENTSLINDCMKRVRDAGGTVSVKEVAVRCAAGQRKIATCAINPVTGNNDGTGILASIELMAENRFSILDTGGENYPATATNSQDLIQGMAHEIKNPLGGIRGAAQLLSSNMHQREDRDYINIILHETDRLNQLVDRISGYIRDKRMLPLNIHRVLEHVYKLLSSDNPDGVVLKRDYDPSLPEITGSEASLIQAFLNLGLNAQQAIAELGEIIFRTRLAHAVVIGDVQHRQAIRVDVQDNGSGVDEVIFAKVFEPLVSSKPQGTGLGLSITREIINMHNGKIDFISQPGRTVFSVFFPV